MASDREKALEEALMGLRYPPEYGLGLSETDRFCDHAAEPCTRCERVRAALALPEDAELPMQFCPGCRTAFTVGGTHRCPGYEFLSPGAADTRGGER